VHKITLICSVLDNELDEACGHFKDILEFLGVDVEKFNVEPVEDNEKDETEE